MTTIFGTAHKDDSVAFQRMANDFGQAGKVTGNPLSLSMALWLDKTPADTRTQIILKIAESRREDAYRSLDWWLEAQEGNQANLVTDEILIRVAASKQSRARIIAIGALARRHKTKRGRSSATRAGQQG